MRHYKATPAATKLEGDAGQFSCIFATFGVVDHDLDIIEPGAIQSGKRVKVMPWGHNHAEPPVGVATIETDAHVARARGELFLSTRDGAEHYDVLKRLGSDCEWSFAFTIQRSRPDTVNGQKVKRLEAIDVFEVSPVLRGAGRGTMTESVKRAGAAAGLSLADLAFEVDFLTRWLDVDERAAKRAKGGDPAEFLMKLDQLQAEVALATSTPAPVAPVSRAEEWVLEAMAGGDCTRPYALTRLDMLQRDMAERLHARRPGLDEAACLAVVRAWWAEDAAAPRAIAI